MVISIIVCIYITFLWNIEYNQVRAEMEDMEDDLIRLYKLSAFNRHERDFLYNLYRNIFDNEVYFFNGVTNEAALSINLGVALDSEYSFESILRNQNINFLKGMTARRYTKMLRDIAVNNTIDIANAYYTWDDLNVWMDDQNNKRYSSLKKNVIGHTFEGRGIPLLKVSTRDTEVTKSAVIIMGGEQGRDWISPAVILNLVNDLLHETQLKHLTNLYDFYFLPIANPDGYAYSTSKNRFWTKNRRMFKNAMKLCPKGRIPVGVEIDRNWILNTKNDINFFTFENEICESLFIGHAAFSEEETKTVYKFLNSIAYRIMAFIDVRGFARMITVPYANKETNSNNHHLLMEILASVTSKLHKMLGITYIYGKTSKYLYNFSGNSADWVKKRLNIPIVYTVYLQHADDFITSHQHISLLTNQLKIIVNETLLVAQDIYGPLFQ